MKWRRNKKNVRNRGLKKEAKGCDGIGENGKEKKKKKNESKARGENTQFAKNWKIKKNHIKLFS